MDPVSAIGLASGILTFVEAGLKLVKIAYNIHNSLDGVLDDNRHRESVTSEVSKAALRLEVVGNARLTPQQESLSDLAKKCKATSTDLVKALNQVKPKQSSSNPFKSLRYAIKAEIKAKDITELENRLKDYRDQLTLALVDFSRVQSAGGFSELISLAKGNEATLKSLTQTMEHLRQSQLSTPDSIASTQAYSQFQRLLMVDDETRRSIYQDHILESLKFDEMHQRFDAVHSAHEDTFRWIYEPAEVIEEDNGLSYEERIRQEALKMQLESRERFIGWLLSQDSSTPIFHISGKLGSGKSTLMKFLCSHQKTEDALTEWAGAKKLAFTSFFFWRNGSKAQKSLDGLCRSILHDVLRERPDLILEVFPSQWSQTKQTPWKVENRQRIPSSVIKNALERLLQNRKLYQQHKFCIFIDGLDEFEPGVQDGLDYIDLVNVLRKWTAHADGNLKLCLSSREEGVFMDEYESDPGFRLQYLTRFDMRSYVRRRLTDLKDEDLKGEFAAEIPRKSSGIFLWTYLVVKMIRNKMTHKASSETLRKYLNTLPRGLESLFYHIFQQLEPNDARKTLRIIDSLQTAKSNNIELPLLAFSLLDRYDNDSEFSLRNGLEDETIPDEGILQAQLRGACGGLIECHEGTQLERLQVLEFVHRSVPDMFYNDTENPQLSEQMEVALDGTNTIDVVSHLCFATFRLSRQTGTSDIERTFFNNMRLAALSGHTDYIQWKILNDAKAMNNSTKRALVGQSILTSKHWELFFQNDIFTMDPTIPLIPVVHTQDLSDDDLTGSDSCSLSAWQFYLTYVILRLNYQQSTLPENLVNVIDRFLRRGADPYCRILVAFEETRVSMTICFRESKTYHAVPRTSSNFLCGYRIKGIIERCLKLRGDPLVDWDKEFTQEFLFREWIAFELGHHFDSLSFFTSSATMRYNNVMKPRLQNNDRCLYNDNPLSPVYARSRSERARAPTPIQHNGHIYDLIGVNSHQQLILRDQCALHLDIRIECFAGRAVILDGEPWQVDYLEAIPDPLDFTKPPRRVLHLKRWTEKGQIQKAIDEPDNLRAIFPGSRGKHTLGPIKHGIRIQKPLLPGTTFEARLRGRELYGPFQIEAKKDGQLVAKHVLDGFCLIKFTIEPHEIAPSYVRVNCPDFGGCFDIDAFLYCEDKLRCRATSVKAIKAMRLPTSDRDPMFGTLSRGPVPLLTNGLDHLIVFEKFIRDCTVPSPNTPQQRRLTILNLSMCDQGDAKIHNPDAIMSVVDTLACKEYVKLLERNRIHIDMFTGVDGPTRQVVHAKAIVIDDRTLFSTGAIVDTKPINKADFSIELPPMAAEAFQVYMQEAIPGGVSNERRAHLGSQLASLGVIINDPIASLTYISRAQHTLLRGARRDLLVSVSELVDPKITKLLVRRAANGVTVTIQVREIDAVSSRILTQATRRYGKRLSVEDVSWWEPRPHYNAIIADDSLAYLGTSYFWPTQRNMIHQGRSLENGVLLEGEAVKVLREQLDELRDLFTKHFLQYWRRLSHWPSIVSSGRESSYPAAGMVHETIILPLRLCRPDEVTCRPQHTLLFKRRRKCYKDQQGYWHGCVCSVIAVSAFQNNRDETSDREARAQSHMVSIQREMMSEDVGSAETRALFCYVASTIDHGWLLQLIAKRSGHNRLRISSSSVTFTGGFQVKAVDKMDIMRGRKGQY
ncbi:hypothetical protein DER46DRAFT_629770 [Fusarium sp. MPI-SDFR-AT-0072]|nr:hypothetical protein DER46DRAFT_629770 [Fusarium sp. MPI-SDFR-AT-0072]